MIISHEHKFIFVKTSKTAGTSIEVFFSPHCGEKDTFTPFEKREQGHRPRNYKGLFNPIPELKPEVLTRRHAPKPKSLVRQLLRGWRYYNHMPAWTIRRRLGDELWSSYFSFCFERNPWEKTLSYYHMLKYRGQVTSLDDFFNKRLMPVDRTLYTDLDGSIMVDKVYRYEELADAMADVCARFDIPFSGELGVRAKGDIRKDRTSYRDVFNASQRDAVADAFAFEIKQFGYEW